MLAAAATSSAAVAVITSDSRGGWRGRSSCNTMDPGKRLKLLRGMLLGPLMAGRPHDNNKPAMDQQQRVRRIQRQGGGLQEVADPCVGCIAVDLPVMVQRAETSATRRLWGGGAAPRAAVVAAPG
jgi:hypothetical protein